MRHPYLAGLLLPGRCAEGCQWCKIPHVRVQWSHGCVPHRLQFPAGSRTGHGRGGRVVPENFQSQSSIQLSIMPWTTARNSSIIWKTGTVRSATHLLKTVSVHSWSAGKTGCLPEVRRVLPQVQGSTLWSRQRKPMDWMQWNISNISCQICQGVHFLKIRNIRMTICHGSPWCRNVADDHCPFSIRGWWLFFYPLSYLTLTEKQKKSG